MALLLGAFTHYLLDRELDATKQRGGGRVRAAQKEKKKKREKKTYRREAPLLYVKLKREDCKIELKDED